MRTQRQSNNDNSNIMLKEIMSVLTIIIMSFIVYTHGIDGEFAYDDPLIYKNPDVSGRNDDFLSVFWHDFWGLSLWHPKSHKSHRPLTIWTLRFTYQLFDGSVSWLHAMNVVVHALVSVLVYLCSRILDPQHILKAFFAALLFVTHPVHVDAVQQIAGTAELLCAAFVLSSFAASRVNRCQMLSGPLCVAAMLCKEQGIMAVPLIVAYAVYINRFDVLSVVKKQISTLVFGIFLVISKILLLSGKPPECVVFSIVT